MFNFGLEFYLRQTARHPWSLVGINQLSNFADEWSGSILSNMQTGNNAALLYHLLCMLS